MRLIALFLLIFISGCGLKTSLVVYDDTAPLPEIHALSYKQQKNRMSFTLQVEGGSGAVVYQIDRAVIEPDCKCIGDWLRYYQSSPSEQRLALTRHVKLRSNTAYAFRLRVMDSLGRKSVWSKVMKTSGHATD